jgi:hypothetical protein
MPAKHSHAKVRLSAIVQKVFPHKGQTLGYCAESIPTQRSDSRPLRSARTNQSAKKSSVCDPTKVCLGFGPIYSVVRKQGRNHDPVVCSGLIAQVKSKCVLPFEEHGSKSTARTSCEWNQEFEMYLEGQAGSALSVSRKNTRSNAPFTKLKLQLWAIDATGKEVHIGDGFVDLSLLMHCKTVYVDVPITSGSSPTSCDSWQGSGASPAQRRAKWRKIAATSHATVVNQEDPDARVHGGAGDGKEVHVRVSLKWSPEALLEGSLVTEETRAEHRRLRLVGGSMEDSAPCRNDRLKKIRESLAESVNSAFSATRWVQQCLPPRICLFASLGFMV